MGERQVWGVEHHVVIGDEIDVEGTRPPAALVRAVAAEGAFHRLRAPQERMRGERGRDRDAGVYERGLILDAPGWGHVVGRAGGELDLPTVAQRRDGAGERVAHVADIAAERQQRLSHGASARW